ncbi:MAG TPA: oxacillin resistance protein FmtC, partial [Caulobacteraceae bacterium]|nr:oxacillin resistance protein FmtC [Caulobacteraceae bacterium]
MRRLGGFRPAVIQLAPLILAALTLACGAMLLVSGATPSDPERFAWLMSWAPVVLVELSHFLSSVLGLALVLTAFGLNRRLDAAWGATLAISFVAAVLAFFKGVDWEETVILLGLCLLLLPLREAFPRTARLSRMEIAPGWLISAFLVLVGAGVLGWWLFHNIDYGDQQLFRVMRDDPSRAIRATVGAGVVLLVLGLWRLFATPATPQIVGDHDPDFERVRAILDSAEG